MTSSSRFLKRSVLLNALFVTEGASNFLLDIALAAALGVGARSDSLYAAWNLPLLLGRGAFLNLTNSFMGLFAEGENDEAAYSHSVTIIGLIAFGLALLMSLTSRWWFPLTVPGATAETQLEGAPLAAILSWLVALLAVAETQRAIYYKLDRNTFPSIVRVLGALVAIIFIFIAGYGQNIRLVAYGLVAGAGIEMLLGFVGLAAMGQRLRFAWPPSAKLKRMGRVVGLPLAGQFILIAAGTGERAIASFLGPGAVTAVSYASRIFAAMERFIFRGFVISTIQTYVERVAANWRRDIRLLLLVSIPIMIVFAVLSTPLITIVFERGRFTAESTRLVATTLHFYALAIPIVAFNRIPYALAYAKTLSRALLITATIYAVVLIGSEIALVSLGLGLPAFGISYFLAGAFSTVWLYRQTMVGPDAVLWSVDELLRLGGVALLALAGTALVVYLLNGQVAHSTWNALVLMLTGGLACVALTGGAVWLLRLPEAKQVSALLSAVKR